MQAGLFVIESYPLVRKELREGSQMAVTSCGLVKNVWKVDRVRLIFRDKTREKFDFRAARFPFQFWTPSFSSLLRTMQLRLTYCID